MSLLSDTASITDEDRASSEAKTCMPVNKMLMVLPVVTPTGKRLVHSRVDEPIQQWSVFHVESKKMYYTTGLENKLVTCTLTVVKWVVRG
jgi:hypothetical protein